MITKEQIENTPLPPEPDSYCVFPPVVSWAGALLGKQWGVKELDAICGCPAPKQGGGYSEMLGIVRWVLEQECSVSEISFKARDIPDMARASRLLANTDQARKAQHEQLRRTLRDHPHYSHQQTTRFTSVLAAHLETGVLLTVVRNRGKNGPCLVGVAGSFEDGGTSMYDPVARNLTWPTQDQLFRNVVEEVQETGWPAFVLLPQPQES